MGVQVEPDPGNIAIDVLSVLRMPYGYTVLYRYRCNPRGALLATIQRQEGRDDLRMRITGVVNSRGEVELPDLGAPFEVDPESVAQILAAVVAKELPLPKELSKEPDGVSLKA